MRQSERAKNYETFAGRTGFARHIRAKVDPMSAHLPWQTDAALGIHVGGERRLAGSGPEASDAGKNQQ
jgi:hypothetical protein